MALRGVNANHASEPMPHIFGAFGGQYSDGSPITDSETPPAWRHEYAVATSGYQRTLKEYHKDVLLWAMSTKTPEQRKAPKVVCVLGGQARKIASELLLQNPSLLQNGMTDGNGNALSGLDVLFMALYQHFPENPLHQTIKSIDELSRFRRRENENIHSVIMRFNETIERALMRDSG